MFLSWLLAALAEHCRRHAWRVLLIGIALAVVSGALAYARLGVTTDTDGLFAKDLPWRQRALAYNRAFPQFQDLLVAVVDGASPEQAQATADGLAKALAGDPTHFQSVTQPDASSYLRQNGLLFLDAKTLQDVLDQIVDAQPFIGQLVADPSARGLFAALTLVAMGEKQDPGQVAAFAPSLRAFHLALSSAVSGHAQPLSWQSLLAGKLSDLGGPYHFVLVRPRLDYSALEPGGAATQAIRDAAAKLEFVRDGSAHVRITGSVALADEEFGTVTQGTLTGTIAVTLLVALWLVLAVRTWRLIIPILVTLGFGLLLTTGFAAAAVGTLNLISIAFAILFVGIAVDFSIQFTVRYRERRRLTGSPMAALEATAHAVGPQVLVAATTAAAGFLAFVPTDFSGVAELGLIAGAGMLIAFACTCTLLPATLTLCRPRPEATDIGFITGDRLEARLYRVRYAVLAAFAAIGVLGAVLAPHLSFDSDPLHTKNPNTEAMRTLADLMASPLTSPYSVDILAPDQAQADAITAKLSKLPLVASAITLSSLVPTDQKEKLDAIADTAGLLQDSLAPRTPAAPVTPADLRMAAASAFKQIQAANPPRDTPLAQIAGDLQALQTAPDATLMAANASLTRFLPQQLDQLRFALQAKPVTVADIPADLANDWKLPDGQVRVHAVAQPQARDSRGLAGFVAEVRSVAPDATGSAVEIVESANTIIGAFRSAALGALIAIGVILALVLRRATDVLLVSTPLLLSALLTIVATVGLHMPLNFANIIALPLLLGVGVSFNIYFVMNWRAGQTRFLGTATARAILFSALTTGSAFGTLAISAHPGTSSLGILLLLSLGCTLITTLLFLPTLLRTLPPR